MWWLNLEFLPKRGYPGLTDCWVLSLTLKATNLFKMSLRFNFSKCFVSHYCLILCKVSLARDASLSHDFVMAQDIA